MDADGVTARFRYVKIPSDANHSIEEHEAAPDTTSAGGDQLPDLLRNVFAAAGGVPVDAQLARAEAARQLGAEQAAGLSTERIVAAAGAGKTETFALVHPSSTNGHRGVYLYVDEAGMLKDMPRNERAADLAARCGTAGQISPATSSTHILYPCFLSCMASYDVESNV
jgi:hypothetical protein